MLRSRARCYFFKVLPWPPVCVCLVWVCASRLRCLFCCASCSLSSGVCWGLPLSPWLFFFPCPRCCLLLLPLVCFSPALSVLLCFLSFCSGVLSVWGLLGFAPLSLAVLFSVSLLLPFAPAAGLFFFRASLLCVSSCSCFVVSACWACASRLRCLWLRSV